jgi:hypothetical protein
MAGCQNLCTLLLMAQGCTCFLCFAFTGACMCHYVSLSMRIYRLLGIAMPSSGRLQAFPFVEAGCPGSLFCHGVWCGVEHGSLCAAFAGGKLINGLIEASCDPSRC